VKEWMTSHYSVCVKSFFKNYYEACTILHYAKSQKNRCSKLEKATF